MWISGRVQNVGYRAWTAGEARAIGLNGWVRNLEDGRVEAVFEGASGLVDLMVDRLRRGPPSARVEAVHLVWEELEGAGDFVVLR